MDLRGLTSVICFKHLMEFALKHLPMKTYLKTFLYILLFAGFIPKAFSQLSGNYTIGTAGDFVTLTDAVNSLTSNGVSGAVTFNIETGDYNEQLIIPQITGASAVNTITFSFAI